jgi:hypothetical protein
MVHFDPAQVISLLVGVVLPLLTGLVTQVNTSAGVKAVVLIALSALTTAVMTFGDSLANHTPFDLGATLLTFVGTFLFGVGSHLGFWKPVGATVAMQRIGSRSTPPSSFKQ